MVDAEGRVVVRLTDPDGDGSAVVRMLLNLHDAYRCLASLAACCQAQHDPGSVEAVEMVREAQRVLAAAR